MYCLEYYMIANYLKTGANDLINLFSWLPVKERVRILRVIRQTRPEFYNQELRNIPEIAEEIDMTDMHRKFRLINIGKYMEGDRILAEALVLYAISGKPSSTGKFYGGMINIMGATSDGRIYYTLQMPEWIESIIELYNTSLSALLSE